MGTYMTDKGAVRITPEYVKVSTMLLGVIPLRQTIAASDVQFITVGSLDRQYVTANRAAGVVLTGGLALLAPSRKRSSIIVALKDGDVREFQLKGKWAKKADLIRADAASAGYRTQP